MRLRPDPSDTVAYLLGRAGIIPAPPQRGYRSAVVEAVVDGPAAQPAGDALGEGSDVSSAELEGEIAVSETDEVPDAGGEEGGADSGVQR